MLRKLKTTLRRKNHPRRLSCDQRTSPTEMRIAESVPNLCLLIQARGAKPVSTMKTLSRTLGFVAIAVVAIVAVLAIRPFAQATPTPAAGKKKFELKFGGPSKENYADVKSQDAFDTAVKTLSEHGGQYEIRFKTNQGAVSDPHHPGGRASIKTDKITTSEVAQTQPAEESSADDPNAVYRVMSNSTTDIKNVLDTFK
jgi:hypothetical protein